MLMAIENIILEHHYKYPHDNWEYRVGVDENGTQDKSKSWWINTIT